MRLSRRTQGPGDNEDGGGVSMVRAPRRCVSITFCVSLGHGVQASTGDHDGSHAAAADALAPSVPSPGTWVVVPWGTLYGEIWDPKLVPVLPLPTAHAEAGSLRFGLFPTVASVPSRRG